MGGQRFAVVTEGAGATRERSLPRPNTVAMGQCLACHIPLTVEEMRVKLLRGRVVTNDLETADIHRSNTPIGGMHDEVSARCPFIDVAGDDRRGGHSGLRHRLSFSDPTSDEHVQWIKLRDRRLAFHDISWIQAPTT